jgi:hypothetical protein
MKNERHWYWIALLLWLIPAVTITLLIAVHPLYRSMTPSYHESVENWWAHKAVYTSPAGFNYLPSFLPFFGLVAWLPLAVSEIIWRWLAFAGLGYGLWRCTCQLTATNRYRAFAVVTVLSLPISLSALRNGQSSAQLAACLVLAAWCLHQQRWWRTTLWLCLALVCKPLGIPAIGLAVMAFPKLWWRASIGVAAVLVGPFFLAPPMYVNDLYIAFAGNLVNCFDTGERTFADLNGVLMVLDIKLTGMSSLIVRLSAGALMAVAALFTQGLGKDIRRVLFWLGFTGIYIMLFTPMNEANSYVMLAPALGLWGWWHYEHKATRTFHAIMFMSLTMFLLPDVIGLISGKYNANQFAKFWNPLMTLVFLGILLVQMKRLSLANLQNPNKPVHGAAPK